MDERSDKGVNGFVPRRERMDERSDKGVNGNVIISIELEDCIVGFLVPRRERMDERSDKGVNGNVDRRNRNEFIFQV